MRYKRFVFRMMNLCGFSLVLLLMTSTLAWAQGSITGTVRNADLSTPANGEIFFHGFLDNTDEEIRIESSDGAGYDVGNWYDDFQNYLTKVPGNPYAYYFYNPTNGQAYRLAKTVPNNSFQIENVTLAAVAWPAQPTGLSATTLSSSSILVRWTRVAGSTYHVYRRLAVSNGSFFRVDNPAGLLSNPGVADSFYVDTTVDGVSAYHYLLIAQNTSGDFSRHSAFITATAAVISSPVLTSIVPNNGPATGNTLVNVYGSGFDTRGAAAFIGTSPLTSLTLVSPFQMTGRTPAGPVGAAAVFVTNTASGLTSNTLAGGFTYNANTAPVLAPIGPRSTTEGILLTFNTSATDAEGGTPILTMTSSTLPPAATYVDNHNGTGTFTWTPSFLAAGVYSATFFAIDNISSTLVDSEVVTITVIEAGNQRPVLAAIGPRSTTENVNLTFGASATDPDATTPALSARNLPTGATFVDNANGTGTFNWTPGFAQSGLYSVIFIASDGSLADSEVVAITVIEAGNQAPILAAIGPKGTTENVNLNFGVSATDPDATTPVLSALNLPTGATFVDNANGTGTFNWTPSFIQSGLYSVTFIASDGSLADSEVVAITVNNAGNQAPVLAAIGPRSTTENVNLTFGITATDPDVTIPALSAVNLPTGATFVDNANGTGTFNWTPGFTQSGTHNVTFIASDGSLADSEIVAIAVIDAGNQLPVIAPIAAQVVAEGGNLSFPVSASDPEGGFSALSALTLPANATFVDNLNGTGSFNFNPSLNQEGLYTVTFVATDDSAAAVSLPVQVTVTHTNQLPVLAAIGPQSTTEIVNLSFPVSAGDPDGDIPHLSTSALPGTATFVDNLNGTGAFSWTPSYADSGTYRVTFYATDAVVPAAIDSEVVVITVIDAGNQPPVLAAIGPRSIPEGGNLNFVVSAADPDGTIPALTATGLPANATFVDNLNGTGAFNFNPNYNQAGLYSVTFVAGDGALADTEIVAITVTEIGNLPPVITPIPDYAVNEGDSLGIDVISTDPEGGVVTLSLSTTLSHFTFVDNANGTGRLVYRPNFFDAGVDTVRFIAVDNGSPQASATEISVITTVDVNRPPVWDTTAARSVEVGHLLTFQVTARDSTDAVKTNRLFLTASGVPVNATFVDNGNNSGTFSFTPTSTQVGLHSVTFLATDQGTPQLSASLPVGITVVAVNEPPVLAPIGPRALTEGGTLVITLSATDPDGTIPALLAEKMPPYSTFVDNNDGTAIFTYTPNYVSSGLHSVTFKAFDGIATDKEIVLIQVYDAGNQRPQFTNVPSPSVTEGQTLVGVITAADPDSTKVKISLDTSIAPMSNFTLVDSGNGVASFRIAPNFVQAGLWDIGLVVSDSLLADTTVMVVTVIEAGNQPPILDTILDQSIKEGRTLSFNVRATDADTVVPKLSTGPLPGAASFADHLNGTGAFVWAPGPTDSGHYQVMFYAEDMDTTGVFDSQLVNIVILDSNYYPEISASPVVQPTTGYEGDTLRYRIRGSDPDGGLPRLGARTSVGQIGSPLPPNMVFVDSLNGFGAMTFVPDNNQGAGNPTKYYIVFYAIDAADSTKFREMGTVTFNIYPKNFRPTMVFPQGSGPFSVAEGGRLTFSVLGFDIDGPLPTLSVQNLPLNATATGRRDSIQFDFRPSFIQAGQYTVSFIVTDNVLAKDTQDVVINVLEAGNQPPVFTTTLPAFTSVSIGLLTEIHVIAQDPDGNPVVISASPIVANASFTDFGDGSATYFITPDASQLGLVYPITFIARDPSLAADTAMTSLSVVTLMRGDTDANRKYGMNDIVYLISYLFRGGSAPAPLTSGDVDNSGEINVADVAYLINYLYKAGPRPPQ